MFNNGTDRLDIELSGKLNSDEMRRTLDELEKKSKNIVNGKMLYDVIDFHLPLLGTIAIDFARLPSMLGLLGKFSRAAVLTDKKRLQTVSEFEGILISGMEIKAFSRDQKAVAEAWLQV